MQRTSPRRSRARARIHDKYKTVVGAILTLKNAWPRHHHREDVSRHAPRRSSSALHSNKVNAPAHRCWLDRSRRGPFGHDGRPVGAPASFMAICPTIEGGATLHNLAQQRRFHSDAPPCGGACSGSFGLPTAGSQNTRGTPAARAAHKIPDRADHKRPNFRSNPRLHQSPLHSHQRDGTLANDLMRIRSLNAKRRAAFSQPFHPSSQLQR